MEIKTKPRGNLSESLLPRLREMIVDGTLPGGTRLNEVHLSAQLGVTRTPLREALTLMVAEGAVQQIPRRGFFVCELTVAEAEEIYPIRAGLDPEALRVSGIPSPNRLDALDALNEKISRTGNVHDRIGLENKWHFDLCANCSNKTLLALIDQFMKRTARYEVLTMAMDATISQGTNTRARVVGALRQGDMDAACALLRGGLLRGKNPVIKWLNAQATS